MAGRRSSRSANLIEFRVNHEYGVKPFEAEKFTEATIRARAEVYRLADALRKLGGVWEGFQVVAIAEQIGVRDGRRIAGRATVTRDDLIAGARRHGVWNPSVSVSPCEAILGLFAVTHTSATGGRKHQLTMGPWDIHAAGRAPETATPPWNPKTPAMGPHGRCHGTPCDLPWDLMVPVMEPHVTCHGTSWHLPWDLMVPAMEPQETCHGTVWEPGYTRKMRGMRPYPAPCRGAATALCRRPDAPTEQGGYNDWKSAFTVLSNDWKFVRGLPGRPRVHGRREMLRCGGRGLAPFVALAPAFRAFEDDEVAGLVVDGGVGDKV